MHNPEGEGHNQEPRPEIERPIPLELTKNQLESLLVAVSNDLTESKRHLADFKAKSEVDRQHALDYHVLAKYIDALRVVDQILKNTLRKA